MGIVGAADYPDDRQALDFRPIERLERCSLVFIWSSITSWLSSTSVGSVHPTTVVLGGALNIKITYKRVPLSTLKECSTSYNCVFNKSMKCEL